MKERTHGSHRHVFKQIGESGRQDFNAAQINPFRIGKRSIKSIFCWTEVRLEAPTKTTFCRRSRSFRDKTPVGESALKKGMVTIERGGP